MAADFVTTVGFDDRQVDRGLQTVDRKFNVLGAKLERSTEGARKFSGALSSTAGIVTGVLGVVTLVAGAIGGVVALTERWATTQERTTARLLESRRAIEDIRDISAKLGEQQSQYDDAREQALRRLEDLEQRIAEESSRLGSRVGDVLGLNGTLVGGWIGADGGRNLQELLDQRDELLQQFREIDRIETEAAQKREAEIVQRSAMEAKAAEERAGRAREQEERERRAIAIEADALRERIELDNLRARGLDDQADALERERDLRRTIREIEESEGISPAERRDLIERAKETARLEAEAAKQKKSAVEAGAGPVGASITGDPGAISLAAGVGGGAVLTRQALGAGGSQAEQQQLARQTAIAKSVNGIHALIDRLVREGRGVIA